MLRAVFKGEKKRQGRSPWRRLIPRAWGRQPAAENVTRGDASGWRLKSILQGKSGGDSPRGVHLGSGRTPRERRRPLVIPARTPQLRCFFPYFFNYYYSF